MIPILQSAENAVSTNNGIGLLTEAISCTVTEELNGEFFLRMIYPIDGLRAVDLDLNRVIQANPCDEKTREPFQVTSMTKRMDGTVEIYAPHISHLLNYYFTKPFSVGVSPGTGTILASSLMSSFSAMVIDSISVMPFSFTFWADPSLTANKPYELPFPKSIRSQLGKGEDSALSYFGGELEWSGYNVRLRDRRGEDRGVKIEYGKNLTGLNAVKSDEGMLNAVIPFWYRSATDTEPARFERLTEYVVFAGASARNPYAHVETLDLSRVIKEEDLGGHESAEALIRSYTQNWLNKNAHQVPFFSSDVNFVPLWKTVEFQNLLASEKIQLGDTVMVSHPGLRYQDVSRVVKTEWDVLNERYKYLELGDLRSTLTKKIVG